MWFDSRNIPVAQIEDNLLEAAQEKTFSRYIRMEQCARMTQPAEQKRFIEQLDADFIVAADGAASLSRRAFPGSFICPHSKGANVEEQRIRLPETEEGLVDSDSVLGIILQPDVQVPQRQALNVIFTLAQNIYLLNSKAGSQGFLNIRITKEEYQEIYRATGARGCSFGSPIRLRFEEDYEAEGEVGFRLPWLRRRIEEGLKLFGMSRAHMRGITGFLLIPAYVQQFCHVLPPQAAAFPNRQRALFLAGDAAISHHFWPGRGLNTGLKRARALTRMLESDTIAQALIRYNSFMTKLRIREMQGRSGSMMKEPMRLDWGAQLLPLPAPAPFWAFWLGELVLKPSGSLADEAVSMEQQNRDCFLQSCKTWRDFLERQGATWPHDAVTDEELKKKIQERVERPNALELHLMVRSAFDNGPNRTAGWPTSRQGGAEVDPADDVHWTRFAA